MVIIIVINTMKIVLLTRMITKQLEKEGARPTLLDPLEVGAPLLAQPLHFMVSFLFVSLVIHQSVKYVKFLAEGPESGPTVDVGYSQGDPRKSRVGEQYLL